MPLPAELEAMPCERPHVIRIDGAWHAVEAVLHHATEGDPGLWATDAEIEAAIAYLEDRLAVLEFAPGLITGLAFAQDEEFVHRITRGPRRATIVLASSSPRLRLIRLLMAHHPRAQATVAMFDQSEPESAWCGVFRGGTVDEAWRRVATGDIAPALCEGLGDPRWERLYSSSDGQPLPRFNQDALAPGYVLVHGDVKEFRADLLRCFEPITADVTGMQRARRRALRPQTGCIVNDSDDEHLIVEFRSQRGLLPTARRWSRAYPELRFDEIVVRRSDARRLAHFTGGNLVPAESIPPCDERARMMRCFDMGIGP